MSEHSAGPWKMANSGVRVDFPDGGCCILWPNTRASNEEIKAVLEANARLIAAAPELLEAMELILRLRAKELDSHLLTLNAKYPTLKQYAEAAIAKAKGGGDE